MRIKIEHVIFGVIAFCLITRNVQAEDPKTTSMNELTAKEFKLTYGSAITRLENEYRNMFMSFVQTRHIRGNAERLRSQLKLASPGSLVDMTTDTTEEGFNFWIQDNFTRTEWLKNERPRWVTVVTPDLSFNLQQDSNTNGFSLDRLMGRQVYEPLTKHLRSYELPALAAYSYRTIPIRIFINQPNVTIEKAQFVGATTGDRKMCRVDWMEKVIISQNMVRGHFLFLPEDNWVLKEYQFVEHYKPKDREEDDRGELVVIDYEELGKNVIPKVKTLDVYRIYSNMVRFLRSHYEVRIVEFSKPRPDVFLLSTFGIDTSPAEPPPPIWVYLIGVASMAFFAAVLMKLVARLIKTHKLNIKKAKTFQ